MNQRAGEQGRKKYPEGARKGKETQKEKRGVKRTAGQQETWYNICIIGIPEGEEEEQGIENLLETVMMENFPNLRREKVTQIQESQRVPSKRTQRDPLQDTS